LLGEVTNDFRVDPIALSAHEGFATEFEQDSTKRRLIRTHWFSWETDSPRAAPSSVHETGDLFDRFAQFETSIPSNHDVLPKFGDVVRNQLVHLDRVIFDKRLIHKDVLGVPLFKTTLDDLVLYLVGLARVFELAKQDLALLVEQFCGYFFARAESRIHSGDLHGNLMSKFMKFLGAGYKIRFAIHLDEHTHFASRMDIRSDYAFRGGSSRLLGSRCDSLFPENRNRVFKIALSFFERGLAIHHARAGLLAQLFDFICCNIHA